MYPHNHQPIQTHSIFRWPKSPSKWSKPKVHTEPLMEKQKDKRHEADIYYHYTSLRQTWCIDRPENKLKRRWEWRDNLKEPKYRNPNRKATHTKTKNSRIATVQKSKTRRNSLTKACLTYTHPKRRSLIKNSLYSVHHTLHMIRFYFSSLSIWFDFTSTFLTLRLSSLVHHCFERRIVERSSTTRLCSYFVSQS